jgi:endonuclease/exonuclease/phosphatase family metal-dependent hydrolase
MRIVQWNSHHGGKRTDDILDTAGFGHQLALLQPDIVCINEVEQFDGYGNDDKVAKWAAALGPDFSGYFANLSGVVNGHGQGNAILARTNEVTSLPLARTLFDSRVALALCVRDVLVVAVHLDDSSQANRFVETVQLLSWDVVQRYTKMLICGDFNAAPNTPDMKPYRVLFNDAWDACTKMGTATSFNNTGATKGARIDAVFAKNVALHSCNVPATEFAPGIFASDHHPVVVEF